jgi:hypothetical protein
MISIRDFLSLAQASLRASFAISPYNPQKNLLSSGEFMANARNKVSSSDSKEINISDLSAKLTKSANQEGQVLTLDTLISGMTFTIEPMGTYNFSH